MEYTVFALAVIESIWPNPEGTDYTGDSDATYSKDTKMFGQEATDVVGETFQEDGGGTNGWFKIAPLSITSFKTQASTSEGNRWSISFTADDMILVSKKGLTANGIMSDIMDSIRESGDKTVGRDSFRSAAMNIPYASRRISLRDGFFNVQDLVTPGDTISIWYYADPAAFQAIEDVRNTIEITNDVKADFHEIIGSGDRRMQFRDIGNQSGAENKLGLPSYVYSAAIKTATGSKTEVKFSNEQIDEIAVNLTRDSRNISEVFGLDLKELTGAVEDRFLIGDTRLDSGGLFADRLALYLQSYFPEEMGDYVKPISEKGDKLLGRSSGVAYSSKATGNTPALIHYYTMMVYSNPSLISLPDSKLKGAKPSVDKAIEAFKANTGAREINKTRPEVFDWERPFSPEMYIAGRNAFTKMLNSKVKKAAKDMQVSSLTSTNSKSRIKRKMLTVDNTGETPYLVMKGHIQGISSALTPSARTITLSGSGMEYPLEKHIMFFDSASQSFAVNGFLQTYLTGTLYNMNSAEQMVYILNRFAPKQIRWGEMSSQDSASVSVAKLNSNISKDVSDTETLRAGTMLFVPTLSLINQTPPVATAGANTENASSQPKSSENEALYDSTRIFTPLTHYSTYRMGESLKSFALADPSGDLGNTAYPYNPEDRVPIMRAIKEIAGAPNLMEFFVDSNGYLVYRVAAEAWERTPRPEYSPILEETEIISFNFNESDENVATTVDVNMAQNSTQGGANDPLLSRYAFGRAVPRVGKLPIKMAPAYTKMDKLEKTMSPDLFRYGMRYQTITDIYGGTTKSSMDKANTIYRFYGAPIKRADVTVLGNPSYRAGDTVLLNLPTVKKRMKKRLKLDRVRGWLEALDEDHIIQYIGNDERANPKYINNYYTNPDFYSGFVGYMDKHTVRKNMIATIKEMEKHISGTITWDLFPTTLWYYLGKSDAESKEVVAAYGDLLRLSNDSSVTLNAAQTKNIRKHLPKIRFNNFLCMSFYIDSVSHSYEYNTTSLTELNLSYGQENICLIHPYAGNIVGFFSVDRKVRDKFPDPQEYAEIRDTPEGVWRKLINEQFLQDKAFRESSFVYQASAVRNTSMYLHKVADQLGKT